MRITLAAVGRWKRGPARALYEEYAARLTWKLDLKEVEERRPLPAAHLKAREGELLLAALPAESMVVALDSGGRGLSSEAFAERLGQWQDTGLRDVAFVIGGAEGLCDDLLRRADMRLSLGPMTWPHMLVRAMLAEQIYRAQSILSGHPYHR